jgi:16S rRNA (guanine966-N2)-methyltransferase
LRIIAGIYKKHHLVSVSENTARPTTDFLKETIFNILPDCTDLDFLDLYAGSGAIALEALSRGANHVVMVEFSHPAISAIYNNIAKLNCKSHCKVIKKKVLPFIKKCQDQFDIIFLDPPYDKNLVNPTIAEIFDSSILKSDSLIVIEHSNQEKIKPVWHEHIIDSRESRHSQVTILQLSKT